MTQPVLFCYGSWSWLIQYPFYLSLPCDRVQASVASSCPCVSPVESEGWVHKFSPQACVMQKYNLCINSASSDDVTPLLLRLVSKLSSWTSGLQHPWKQPAERASWEDFRAKWALGQKCESSPRNSMQKEAVIVSNTWRVCTWGNRNSDHS